MRTRWIISAVLVVIGIQRRAPRRPVTRAVVLGMRQTAMGFGVVVVTAMGVLASAS